MGAEKRPEPGIAATRPKTMIEVKNVWEEFRLYRDQRTKFTDFLTKFRRADRATFWALKGVSFNIHQGDIFGLIGENGSGKSTLLKCIAGILPPTKGSIRTEGTISPLLELGAGFHPDLSGRENIYLNASILGLAKKQVAEVEEDIIAFSELEEFIDSPLKNYSSGMKVRLGFAVAINVNPDILLIDEVLAVGDADFHAKCQARLNEYREQKKTIMLVSHTLPSIAKLCNRAAWVSKGELQVVGETKEVIDTYLDFVNENREAKIARGRPRNKAGAGGAGRSPAELPTKEVTIEKVSLLDEGGHEQSVFRTGEGLGIQLVYSVQADANPTKIIFEIAFYSWENALIALESYVASGDDLSGSIEFRVDQNPFTEGRYRISVGARGKKSDPYYDYHDQLYELLVADPSTGERGGAIKLNGRWRQSSDDAGELEVEGSEKK